SPRRDLREPAVRIRGARSADCFEQRQILVAVGVEPALREVDAVLARQRSCGQRLSATVAGGPHVAPGEPTVLDLELRAEHVPYSELARQRLDLEASRGRHHREGVTPTAMCLHEGA